MKSFKVKGLTNHSGPESCSGEALTEERGGGYLERAPFWLNTSGRLFG